MVKNRSIIALDIAPQSIKLLELEEVPDGWRILNFSEREILPPQDKAEDQNLKETLKSISLEGQLRNNSIVALLPRHLCSVKYIILPSEDYSEIQQMLPFEAEKIFPFSLTKFELGFSIQKTFPDKTSQILVAATEKTIIEELLNQFKEADLTIKRIGLSSLALAKAYLFESKENALLIYSGETATEMGAHASMQAFPRGTLDRWRSLSWPRGEVLTSRHPSPHCRLRLQ